MQEVLEQIIDYLKGIWIKRRYIMIATWLICPIGWYAVSQMDDVYKSNARVYVDTQSVLGPLLRGIAIQTNSDVLIRHMVNTLLSRENLEKISRQTDLDVRANTPQEYNAILDNLKKDIKISSTGRENIFTIAYENKDAELAENVVSSALNIFMENTLGENRTDTNEAQKFLDAQIKEYESRLVTAETKLTEFRQKYSDILPNSSGGYYSQLSQAKENLKAIELQVKEKETQLASVKSQLSNQNSSTSSAIKGSSSIQTTYDSRIEELQATLDNLQLRYTDMHPDVKEVKRRLEQLNTLRDKEVADYLAAQNSDGAESLQLSSNPVVQEVQIQYNQLQNELASLNVRSDDAKAKVQDLENKIHILPEIEQELVALNRGYDITKQKHDELLQRRETASLAQVAEETTSKIQFRVIDPPRAGDKPSGPNRILFQMAVLVVGLGVGVGLSLLFSQIKPVVTSSAQLSKATGIPIFGTVTASENLGLQRWHRKKTILFIVSNTLLLLLLAAFMTYSAFPEAIKAPLARIF